MAAAFTLEKMGSGGVYDQIGGGFHRYSVDERWCVPHFEKMSYDNSELLRNFLHGYQVAREPFLLEVAEGIIDWTNAVLSDQSRGGFYASQDADQTLDDDGDYFTWTQEEVRAVLTPEESRIVELRYDVEPRGEMHHNPSKNVLWIARSIAEVTQTIGGVDMASIRKTLAGAKAKLLAARGARPAPFVDTTLYVAWNAMFVSAYLDAAAVLGGDKGAACRAFALKTLDRMVAEAWSDARGFAHRIGGARLDGSLDDQVFAGLALLDAYEATLDRKYFDAARRAADFTIAEYFDPEGGGFFDRASGAAPMGGLELRRKPLQDSPTPGANSSAAILLDRLYAYAGDARYAASAKATLEAFAGIAPQFGIHASSYGLAALLHAPRAVGSGHHRKQRRSASRRARTRRAFRLPLRQGRAARYARTHGGGIACPCAGRDAAAFARGCRAGSSLRGDLVPPARQRSRCPRGAADAKASHAWRGLRANR